jgi:hypothetical protein
MIDFPDIETGWGKMNQVITELSLKLRLHFSELIQEGEAIPIFPLEDRNARTIYLPAATSWRVQLWNLFVSRNMTLADIAKSRDAIHYTPPGVTTLDHVRHVFDLRESTKYRSLIPFSKMLGVEIQAQVVPI